MIETRRTEIVRRCGLSKIHMGGSYLSPLPQGEVREAPLQGRWILI